jgi:hypothetical protein
MRNLKPHQLNEDGSLKDLFDSDGMVLVRAEDWPSPAEIEAAKRRREEEIAAYWAKLREPPLFKRSLYWWTGAALPNIIGCAMMIAFVTSLAWTLVVS